jgi:hypothetical protein
MDRVGDVAALLRRFAGSWRIVMAAAIGILVVRLALLQEPWNSDDMVYYEHAQLFSEGRHLLQTHLPEHGPHLVLRIGLIAPVALAISFLGYSWLSYYLWPLLFSVLGGIVVATVARRTLPWWAAIGAVALHIVLPFEIRHGTVLFTDLPAAALSLIAVVSLAEMVRRTDRWFRGSFFLTSLAVLVLFWAYLMRANQPVFMVPAIVVLAWQRRGILALAVGAVLFLGLVLIEQSWYSHLGGSFGYRWDSVARSQTYWTHFYPRFDVLDYFLRPFAFALRQQGVVGLGFILLAVPAHVYVLLRSREVVLKAIAATGLAAFVVFNYYVFDVQDGRLVAFVSQHRVLQPFYYSSLLALAAAAAAIWQRFGHRVRDRKRRRFTLAAATAVFAFALLDFFFVSISPRNQVSFAGNRYRLASVAVGDLLASDPSSVAGGTRQATRTLRLFVAEKERHETRWHSLPYDEIAGELTAGTLDVLVRDRGRERSDLAYMPAAAAQSIRNSIREIEDSIVGRYLLAYRDERFDIFSRDDSVGPSELTGCSGLGSATDGWGAGSVYPSDAQVELQGSTIRYRLGEESAYAFSAEMVGFSAPPANRPAFALDPRNTYHIRLNLGLLDGEQANPSVWFLEYDGRGKRTNTSSVQVRDGNATLWVVPDPTSRYYAVALRLSGNGAVRILSCRMHAYRREPAGRSEPSTGSARGG